MKKEMLINVLQPEECRIAIIENGVLEELYVERTSQESYVGNIYKGRIVNIEPSIQAAFVDFGIGRNGFLHVSDVDAAYYKHLEPGRSGGGGRDDRGGGRDDRGGRGGRDRDRGDRGGRGGRGGRDRDDRGGRSHREPPPPRSDDYYLPPEAMTPEHAAQPPRAPEPEFNESFDAELPPPPPHVRQPQPHQHEHRHEKPPAPAEPKANDSGSVWGAAMEILGLEIPDPPPPPPIAPAPAAKSLDSRAGQPLEGRATSGSAPTQGANAPRSEDKIPVVEALPVEEKEERGRGRGRGRGRRDEGEAKAPPAAPPAPPAPQPKPMESAERRTSNPDAVPFGAGILDDLAPRPTPAKTVAPEPPPSAESFVSVNESSAKPTAETPPAAADLSDANGGFEHDSVDDLANQIAEEAVKQLHDDFDLDELGDDDDLTGAEEEDESGFGEHEDELLTDMELEDGEVPQPRARPRGDDRDRRGGGGRGGDRRGGPRGGPRGGRPGFGRPKPLIQDVFKRGQEVIVQVIKEGIGTKGPTLSTYVSIAGRYLVLMPGLNRIGVSRKIVDEEARSRLKEILQDLKPPKGVGFIIRTAGIDRNKRELQNDLAYLLRLWQVMVRRIKKMKAPAEIYQESDMITRTIRDTFTNDIDTIWVDEPNAFAHAQEFSQIVMPRYADRIKQFDGSEPLFHKYRIEEEIVRIQQKKLPLPMGGSIVIEQTEALVAIDVNSGNFRAENNAEETAYQMNLQAAKEIARQLRLRDMGGVIVNDFIDMRDEKHKRGVEKALRDALRRDRARTKILKISQFGLIEMTRQRIRPSLKRSVYHDCPACGGAGLVKTVESMSIEVMRLLQLAAHRDGVHRLDVRVHTEVAAYLLNRKRKEIAQLEEKGEKQISVLGVQNSPPEALNITCYDRNGSEIKVGAVEPARPPERDRGRGRYRGDR